MTDVQKVVMIGDITVTETKEALKMCLYWLDKDAKFQHPNHKVNQVRMKVAGALLALMEDERKFLGKKFNLAKETTDAPSMETPTQGSSTVMD